MYDQTVDHTPQARRTVGKVKSQQREPDETRFFTWKLNAEKTTGRRGNPL